MTPSCGECDRTVELEQTVVFRLVRCGAGAHQTWGTRRATPAPAVLLCETCVAALGLSSPVVWNPQSIPEGGRLFGWQFTDSCCSRYVAPEWWVKKQLPRAHEGLVDLERAGTRAANANPFDMADPSGGER